MSVLTSRNELINITDLDWFHVVDASDTTDSPQGTSKKIRRGNILGNYTGFDSRYYTQTTMNNFLSGVDSITGYNKTDWDTAFGWGNHALVGYLTSFTETDPIFTASDAFDISSTDISNWNTAFGWGDHASENYAKVSAFSDGHIVIFDTNGDLTFENNFEWNGFSFNVPGNIIANTITVDDEIYGVDWNGNTEVPTKNALYDKIETLASGGGTWGSITGTLSDQTDLQAALDSKVDLAGDIMTGSLTSTILISNGSSVGVRVNGLSSGIANVTNVGFYESDGTTRQGLVGFPSSGNSNLSIANEVIGTRLDLLATGGNNGLTYFNGTTSNTVWHQGNDGGGSGLDADTVDGLHASSFIRTDASSTVGNNSVAFEGTTLWRVSSSDIAHQRCDARDLGEESKLHWYGVNTTGTALPARHAFYDGDSYVDFTALNNGITIGGGLLTTGIIEGQGGVIVPNTGNLQMEGGAAITRTTHVSGYLEGGHNNIGNSAGQTSPIYVMGSSFVPSSTTLGDMYGIGFANGGSAGFLNSTDLGTNPSGWGMYVASDGNARIFLDATGGTTRQLGIAYASNFQLNSDERRKKKIEKYDPEGLNIDWYTFELDTEEGNSRVGTIAQSLLENPETERFVEQTDPSNYTVKYFDLLCAAMAEKDKQIESLEQRIERLEQLIMNK